MPEIKVTFSDGSTEFFHEEQTFQTIVKSGGSVSQSEVYSIWPHHND